MITTVEDALAIAQQLHHGQKYADGANYYTAHIVPVVHMAVRLAEISNDVDPVKAGMAAALHDTIEDCGVTTEDLLDMGVPLDVVLAVEALTQGPTKGRQARDDYIRYVMSYSALSALVKVSDHLINSDPERLAVLDDQKKATYFKGKYELDRAVMSSM